MFKVEIHDNFQGNANVEALQTSFVISSLEKKKQKK